MAPDTPPIADLLARFLATQADARAAGIAETPAGEVEPYEAVAFATVDPRTAWNEAVLPLALLDADRSPVKLAPPADWAALVATSALALPMAAASFPQLVRDLTALVNSDRSAARRPSPPSALSVAGLESWANKAASERRFPEVLLAIGTLRLAGHLDTAARLLDDTRASAPERWKTAVINEEAALAWERGDADTARRLWANLPESGPACFNRGMSALFTGRTDDARTQLTRAAALLPDDGPWQHLARLYLALAQM